MTVVAVTQRVMKHQGYNEKWDALDQKWADFLQQCGIIPLIIPNRLPTARALLDRIPIDGVLLTGGNDIPSAGGDVQERDQVELHLLETAITGKIPLLGVCRGMQMIQNHFGIELIRIDGHVKPLQTITVNGVPEQLNSYHNYGTKNSNQILKVWARSEDGVVKAVRHSDYKLEGIMWHPERNSPFSQRDIERISIFFKGND
jgi:N5-(cytidine 5'-diphosphoramidyl)-L-glutamine hydrolase